MRLVKEKVKKYKKIKNKESPSNEEGRFVRHFERTLKHLNEFDRNFFSKIYLYENNADWWKKYYTKTTYYRMRENVSRKFLDKFGL